MNSSSAKICFLLAMVTALGMNVASAQQGWFLQSSGTTQDLYSVSFPDELFGVAVGGRPGVQTIRWTSDGGANWFTGAGGTGTQLFGVHITGQGNGIAVGDSGTILRTFDYGRNWRAVSPPVTSARLYAIAFRTISDASIVGASGTILRTTDGGVSWTSQTSGTANALRGIALTSGITGGIQGTAVGDNGTIVRTIDGINWSPQTSGVATQLNSVSFFDTFIGTAVGNQTVLRTTNGGASWFRQPSGEIADQKSVDFVDRDTGYVVGTSGTILRTRNTGTLWSRQNSRTSNDLFGVSFPSFSTGWAVGNAGTIVKTSRGGITGGASFFPTIKNVNFGSVIVGNSKTDSSLIVTNDGNTNLSISLINSSNSQFTFSPTTASIAPGNSQLFRLTYAPTNAGTISARIVFSHNGVTFSDTVNVSGTGLQPVFSVLPRVLPFGNLLVGSSRTDSVTVTNTGTAPLVVSSVTSNNARFTVTPPNVTLQPAEVRRFLITFSPTATGLQSGGITFFHNASSIRDTVLVSGTGIAPAFSVLPTSLSFGNVLVGALRRDSVTVTNTGTATLNITNVASTNPRFTFDPPNAVINPSASRRFYITFAPLVNGSTNGIINFTHDAVGSPTGVPVAGNGVAPSFQILPSSIDFRTVNINTPKVDSVTVTNTGTAPLNIVSVVSSNPRFTVNPANAILPPLASNKFYITFRPNAVGLLNANITFMHDAAGSPSNLPVSGTGVEPIFSVSPLLLNFRDVRVNTTKQDSLTVTNTGTAPLIISSVTTSLARFVVTPTNAVINPAGSTKFFVSFTPNAVGPFSGNVTFTHNAAGSPTDVPVSGNGVSPSFSVLPSSVSFGNVVVNTNKLDSVIVTNSGSAPLTISNVSSSNARFTVAPTTANINPSQQARFLITFSPDTSRAFNGNVTFTHDAAGSPSTVPVAGTGVLSRFSVSPSSLNFGNVPVNVSRQDSVTVTNTGTATLTIASATSSNARYVVNPTTASILPSGSRRFYITFTPNMAGNVPASISFIHDAPGSPSSVTLSGNGIAPNFSASPTSINFGEVIVGATKRDSVTIKNIGTALLNVSNVASSNARFVVQPTNASINPSDSVKFYVTFSPVTIGNAGGNVTFTHNAAGSPTNVPVAGVGVASSFQVTPTLVRFGEVVLNTNKRDSVTVTNSGTSALVISSVSSMNNQFVVQPTVAKIPSSSSARFSITFTPASTGVKTTDIIFVHNAEGSPDTVAANGTGVSAGFLITPPSLSFGNIQVGGSRMDSLTVSNTGTAPLTVSNVSSSDTRFIVLPTSAIISPASSRVFRVTFTPNVVGPANAFITFFHDAVGSPTTVSASGSGVASGFSLNPSSLNFANVRVGVSRVDSVTVTNTGSATLNVANVASSSAQFTAAPASAAIPPSSSRVFRITFSPTTTGIVNGNIVFTHDAAGSPASLPVSGNGVVPLFSVSPRALQFGNVVLNSTTTDSVLVINDGGASLAISSVSSSDARFTVSPSFATVSPSSSRWFEIRFTPNAVGLRSSNIVFRHDASSIPDTVVASGTGVTSTLSWSPTNIAFGRVRVGATRLDSITLTNSGTFVIQVFSITSSNARFSVSPQNIDIPVAGAAKIFVTFSPTTADSLDAGITLVHNAAGSPTSILVSGRGLAPFFSVSRQALAFGNVRVDSTRRDTLTVGNPGTDTLRISSSSVNNNRFGISPTLATIPPNASQRFDVSFSPNAVGSVNGLLQFIHNANGSPNNVALSGNGIAPQLAVVPHAAAFGDLAVGSTASVTVNLLNRGGASLKVDSVRVRGRNASEFAIIGSSGPFLPLAFPDTIKIVVRFSPTSVDSNKVATLFVYSDSFGGIDTVALRGSGRGALVQIVTSGDSIIIVQPPPNFPVNAARLFFRKTGKRSFDSLALNQNGQTFSIRFPDSLFTLRGFEYFVAVINSDGRLTNPESNPTSNPLVVQVRVQSAQSPQQFEQRKFKMISIPLEATNTTPQQQLFDDFGAYDPFRWRLFRWDGEQNRNLEFDSLNATFTPGTAFWLVTREGGGFDADDGRSVNSSSPFNIQLQPGWNQIATPFAFSVSWDAITHTQFLRHPYFWDGSQYVSSVSVLNPWDGYFVLNDSTDIITLSVPAVEASGIPKVGEPIALNGATDFVIRFSATVENSSIKDEYNYVGFLERATNGRDLLDLPEPPPIENTVQLSFVEDGRNYLANFKPLNVDGRTWTMIARSSAANQTIRVSLSEMGQMPNDFAVYILDQDQFTIVSLSGNSFVVQCEQPNSKRSFKVIIGTKQFAEQMSNGIPLVPLEFTLDQNFPNPFNPSTTIRYTLGTRSQVSLEIFNSLGQLVKTLLTAEQLTGSYNIVWDGTNTAGASVASGVYIYRLRAGGFVASKKLLLLR